jgi:hypothetical protein
MVENFQPVLPDRRPTSRAYRSNPHDRIVSIRNAENVLRKLCSGLRRYHESCRQMVSPETATWAGQARHRSTTTRPGRILSISAGELFKSLRQFARQGLGPSLCRGRTSGRRNCYNRVGARKKAFWHRQLAPGLAFIRQREGPTKYFHPVFQLLSNSMHRCGIVVR